MSDLLITAPVPAGATYAAAGAEWTDWLALLKPRVMTLVVFTGLVGMLIAPGHLHPVLQVTAILCIATASGAAGAINMWYDRDIDTLMRRTASRPVPAGRIAPGDALAYGVGLSFASVTVMALATNLFAAVALAGSIAFYVFVYTMWLKRRTPYNIVVGGAAGAFPAVIGWAAVTGDVSAMPALLFAIVFLWTPPHFWALSLYICGDYARAEVPMLPVVAGARATRRQIMLYTLVLAPFAVLPWPLGYAGAIYGVTAILLGAGFLAGAWRVLHDRQDAGGVSLTRDAPARMTFRFSLAYLALLFLALAIDHFAA